MAKIANRYSDMNTLVQDYEGAPAPLTRDEVGFDLSDPYQRANYNNFLTYEEIEVVALYKGDAEYRFEHAGRVHYGWAPDVYGVPVYENNTIVGAKVYQSDAYFVGIKEDEYPRYVGFVECTEDTFEEAVTNRDGLNYESGYYDL